MQKIVNFIKQKFKSESIALHEPKFIGNEKRYLNECIDSGFVSSVGKFVTELEVEFAKKVGAKFAVAAVNGTSALHICLLLSDVKATDEVITQPLSFIATANAISYTGARPIFLDVDSDTLGLSPDSLLKFLEQNCELKNGKCINKTTQKTIKACVPMHTFGLPCKIDKIAKICKSWGIVLVEDAAESLGSHYKDKHTGTFGALGAFSFNGNKIITSGGGGMIVTDDESLAKKVKHLTTTAKIPHPYEYVHDQIAFNYRMPNLNAALLLAQLENLELFLRLKRELAQSYDEFFADFYDVKFIKEPSNSRSNYWLNAILFKEPSQKDEFLKLSNESGVMTRPIWQLLNELKMYENCQTDELKNAKFLASRVVNLPSSAII